mmetsp:Transcript_1590/g.3456  ORF Transcript_1590/g.3456 Transcript_1590/m.3456 type:complete len:233 (-) Transcript_1590:648-1346(-)
MSNDCRSPEPLGSISTANLRPCSSCASDGGVGSEAISTKVSDRCSWAEERHASSAAFRRNTAEVCPTSSSSTSAISMLLVRRRPSQERIRSSSLNLNIASLGRPCRLYFRARTPVFSIAIPSCTACERSSRHCGGPFCAVRRTNCPPIFANRLTQSGRGPTPSSPQSVSQNDWQLCTTKWYELPSHSSRILSRISSSSAMDSLVAPNATVSRKLCAGFSFAAQEKTPLSSFA